MSTIVTRAGKGSALTYAEMDANFNNLNNDKLEVSSLIATNIVNTPAGSISAINVQTAINELDTEKAKSGANTDITSINGTTIPTSKTLVVTTDISSTVMPWVAPGTTGNLLTSNGTIWTSTANPNDLPSQTGNAGTSLITNGTVVSWGSSINLSTVASLTGTAVNFTIPTWANCIKIIITDASGTSTGYAQVRLGTSGVAETTGYSGGIVNVAAAAFTAQTTGFYIGGNTAATLYSGVMTIVRQTGNVWKSSHIGDGSSAAIFVGEGGKTLAGALDLISIVMPTGTFDSGTVNIQYE